ncbi:hypothetical protein SAMD00019534_031910 [Acytostelium subglobosum LB1]|uniref:hypothetical protein n=1 Tax=Acytostelium subglobosum LB1 TaxID=1410327 RepID=UPI00064523AE|nr:hypothetical protein SAMD00019534_031910 [Acytostelium subglobosum LB1]GAM20016.1 hypothetical protein SAMD00019534_031910 [Acytostelium subglobosum LB1]|eukprot:XP_012756778.1 hypothetical protein SAMD00019534_031910 [Acytostelium subglobosum LB1]
MSWFDNRRTVFTLLTLLILVVVFNTVSWLYNNQMSLVTVAEEKDAKQAKESELVLAKIRELEDLVRHLTPPPLVSTAFSTTPPSQLTEDDIKQLARERLQGRLDPFDPKVVLTDKDMLTYFIDYFNEHSEVLNKNKFKLADNHIPIVIRVFNKPQYFKVVLEFYKRLPRISETMLIISHDGIFKDMFDLVSAIDFCQVKQIIHPYSSQVLSNRFPGKLPIKEEADPNHPRDNNVTPLKHHYWWHLNYIWEALLKNHQGDICLMEEDHLPLQDFYQTLTAVRDIRNKDCPECWSVQLEGSQLGGQENHMLGMSDNIGNMGVTFDRKHWNMLKGAAKEFCEFNDYNWDWTMQRMKNLGKIGDKFMFTRLARIVHIGTCGVHLKGAVCEVTPDERRDYEQRFDNSKNNGDWSKYDINTGLIHGYPQKNAPGFGSWDTADRQHCLKISY